MGCKQLWYQHAFHVKQGHEDVVVCVCLCVFVHVFALCVVWHIFTEGCVLSLSFGVRPEAMSNWSLHTFRLDSHWHARPWLCFLCHEKEKQWHRNMPSLLLRETLLLLISFCVFALFAFRLFLSASRGCVLPVFKEMNFSTAETASKRHKGTAVCYHQAAAELAYKIFAILYLLSSILD